MRHCGACGRPVPEHPTFKVLGNKLRFCPIRRARTRKGQPQRFVFDPRQAKAALNG